MSTPSNSTTALTGEALTIALETGRALGKPVELPGYAPAIIYPPGYQAMSLIPAPDKPLPGFMTQSLALLDAESFISYVTGFRQDNTRVFFTSPGLAALLALSGSASFLAVMDYHLTPAQAEKGAEGDADVTADDTQARRCVHRVRFDCPFSIEWRTWIGVNGKALTQEAFIDFIEANARDVIKPAAADLMEMAMNFEAASQGKFQNKINRTVSGKSLTWTEQTEASSSVAGNKVTVPEGLGLSLPVFEGGACYDLEARLVYAVKDGRLTITIALLRPHLVIRTALEAVRKEIADALKIEVLSGGLV